MTHIKSLRLKTFFWHFAAIITFILCEISMIIVTGTNARITDFFIFYFLDITGFYTGTYLIIPIIFSQTGNALYKVVLCLVWVILLSSIVLLAHLIIVNSHNISFDWTNFWTDAYRTFWRRLYLFSLALGFWYARHSVRKERDAREKERLVLESKEREVSMENALLRAHLTPHLMYNTLSGIYAHVLIKAPEAAKLVFLLSEIMDYALGSGSSDTQPTLATELEHIGKLVELQRELYKNNLHLHFSVEVPEDALEEHIPAMLFTNLVDNVFKHGIINDPDQPAIVRFEYREGFLVLSITNTIADRETARKRGLGRKSTRARLDRYYPDAHNMTENFSNNRYHLTLKIKI